MEMIVDDNLDLPEKLPANLQKQDMQKRGSESSSRSIRSRAKRGNKYSR
jgi:hypothetical protein